MLTLRYLIQSSLEARAGVFLLLLFHNEFANTENMS